MSFCGYLLYGLPLPAYALFACWLAVALAVYLLYSRHHSRLRPTAPAREVVAR
ncbi:hypothetical protein ACFYXH_11625 [Streptomyces sp. NPDC002730]|uniref:hypothetical protein n=1 Tax=Streptomyces sp. NPDC002730 TaxID=3364662 RepID=UPI0036A5D3EA